MKSLSPTRRPRPSEEGYILVVVICMLALFTLALSIAVPRIAKQIQRDREIETMQRGKQYIRAIKLYYKKFHAYPPNADALIKTSEIRYLRKKYIDPTTGKEEWKPVLFGQNKASTALGFFGQPIAGSTIAGTGPSGGNGLTGATSASSTSLFSSTSTDSSTSTSTSTSSSSSSTSSSGLSGKTFGGAGIIGFSPNSPKQSILMYKKKNHYNEWEFVYDPLADQITISSNLGSIGQSASSTSTPVGSTSSSSTDSGSGATQSSPQ